MTTLAELKAEAARLNARIAELEGSTPNRVTPPPPVKDEGPRVVLLLDERSDLPSLKETERLYSALKHLAPWPLNDKYDADRPFRGFSCCYRWISNKGRTEFPNPKFALGFWLEACKVWLKARGSMTGDVDASVLILAVYAAGDIAFCPANSQLGHVWEIGLAEHAGRPADVAGWRRVLAGGAAAVRPPSSPGRRRAPLSPVRIYGG
jgi:hypothetical protein